MSPQSELHPAVASPSSEYSQDERLLLLQLAHRSIEAALDGRPLDLAAPTPHLDRPRGAFTTLHLQGKLRGCIGYVIPTHSLYRTVAEMAQAAAFDDPRFPPVTAQEVPYLQIGISVLSLPQPIRPEEVIPGFHGLIVSQGDHRGLLLPQVPIEWHWDRETFLSQTCLKAGLPANAWRQNIDLQSFTAEVFEDAPRETSER